MTAAESKGLKKGSRVYWRGDAADGGSTIACGSPCLEDRGVVNLIQDGSCL